MRIRWYIFLQVAIVVMPFIAQGQRCRTLPNEHKPFAQDALQSCQWKLSQHSLLDDNATAGEDFSVSYDYNAMSSPTMVQRKGVVNMLGTSEVFGMLDNLSYNYNGNQVTSITAEASGTDYVGRTGYVKSAMGGTSHFTWDAASRLTSDTSRDISQITYNYLDKPEAIWFTNGNHTEHRYDSDGTRTTSVFTGPQAGQTFTRTYAEGITMRDGEVEYVLFPGGYFDAAGAAHYHHHDYQGNVTMVTDSLGGVEQHVGYYPYGEPWREPIGQPYLFSGKERQREHCLFDYHFGARQYNAATMLWSSPDKYAEKYPEVNPLLYCKANPIMGVDFSGQLCIFINGFHIVKGGTSAYWDGVDKEFVNILKDNNCIYFDGSCGGLLALLFSDRQSNNLSYGYRIQIGYVTGLRESKSIIEMLDKGESIKIISHSMGSAFAKGFITALKEYLTKNNKPLSLIEFEFDIAPFQGGSLQSVAGITTYETLHKDDILVRYTGDHQLNAIRISSDNDKNQEHYIKSFINTIRSLGEGEYIYSNGKFIQRK